MKIARVIATPGLNGFYNDDKAPGFRTIRQPGESASIIFILEDGSYAFGDALVVQYSGSGGREGLMTGAQMAELAETVVAPAFEGREVTSFREMSAAIEKLEHKGRARPGGRTARRSESRTALAGGAAAAKPLQLAVELTDPRDVP